jgi:hypothetical protein
MLSAHLIRVIETHAEELTRELLDDLGRNPRTPSFHTIARDQLRSRVYDVYHNLGKWIAEGDERHMEEVYGEMGRRIHAAATPASELIYVMILIKEHLRNYVRRTASASTSVELHQEAELNLLIGHFFDKALYHSVRGYEGGGAATLAS